MPRVNYYDVERSALLSLFAWNGTVFKLVLKKREFWGWVVLHVIAVAVSKLTLDDDLMDSVNWNAAVTMQYFLAFFVTFYNGVCLARFMTLYPMCTALNDSVSHFVQQLSISLGHPDLEQHRTMSTKYLLAAVHEFYAINTGGWMTDSAWREIRRKGLLTSDEVIMLKAYPVGRSTSVLTSWVLIVIQDGLKSNCLWEPPVVPPGRVPQTVHVYNRLHDHILDLVEACNGISHLVAMPVPYVYYHLMNVILVLNLFLIAVVPALLKEWYTIAFVGAAAFFIMGLREVSCRMADPFGDDTLDFPVEDFVRHTFDKVVVLLETMGAPGARARVQEQLGKVTEFSVKEYRRGISHSVVYNRKRTFESSCSWSKPLCLPKIREDRDVTDELRLALCSRSTRKAARRSNSLRQLTAGGGADAPVAEAIGVESGVGGAETERVVDVVAERRRTLELRLELSDLQARLIAAGEGDVGLSLVAVTEARAETAGPGEGG